MQFIVLGRDGTDSEAPARRQAARAAHIARGDEMVASGQMWYGAALRDDAGAMCGSMILVDFPDQSALQAWLDTEPYVIGNVWHDIEILPCSVRDPWQFNRPEAFFSGKTS